MNEWTYRPNEGEMEQTNGDPHASIRQGNNSRPTNSAVFPVSVAVKLRTGRHFLPYIKTNVTTPEASQLSKPRQLWNCNGSTWVLLHSAWPANHSHSEERTFGPIAARCYLQYQKPSSISQPRQLWSCTGYSLVLLSSTWPANHSHGEERTLVYRW